MSHPSLAQNLWDENMKRLDEHQYLLDEFDGLRDGRIDLQSDEQSTAATNLYIHQIDMLQDLIALSDDSPLGKKQMLWELLTHFKEIKKSNYHLYARFQTQYSFIEKCLKWQDSRSLKELLKSDIETSVEIIPFFADQYLAKDVLMHIARFEPSQLLKNYDDFAHIKFVDPILNEVAHYAPLHLSHYLGSNNLISRKVLNNMKLPHLANLNQVYRVVGSSSRAYILMDEIVNNGLDAKDAHNLVRYKDSLFKHLIVMKGRSNILAEYDVQSELRYLALLKVREINELHEEADEIRFASIDTNDWTADQIYYMMVYSDSEIYTSSFLGMYKRMMDRYPEGSGLEFLYRVGLTRYATFIQMCAAYNTLSSFIDRMEEWELKRLFYLLSRDIKESENPLAHAVHLIEIHSAITDDDIRQKLEKTLKDEAAIPDKSPEIDKLFSQVLQLLNINKRNEELDSIVRSYEILNNERLFSKGEHIQQHFFFEDEDGKYSFYSFLQKFKTSNWKISYYKKYVLISSVNGRKVKIYANKPTTEIEGQNALSDLFAEQGRFPDLIVHRGHSYYVEATIEHITPSSKLVILGSCGGYQNMNTILSLSPETQLITTKQVGMRIVNDELLFNLSEKIRKGENVVWDDSWTELSKSLANNKKASERFSEYIPPNKHLSAILIKSYKASLIMN